jgi:Holliday junction resolvase RusA-like endonuclease
MTALTEQPRSTDMLVITVHGTPAPQGSKHGFVRGGKVAMVESSQKVKPWRQDIKHAALAALPNRDLDAHFPRRGPCLICGVPGEDARHRVVDAIADRVLAGDDEQSVADDHGVTVEAVHVAVADRLYPLTGPLGVEITFTLRKPASAPKRRVTWPDRRPDLDKLLRSTFDGLDCIWGDDSQVVEVTARKVYPDEGIDALRTPGAVIRVWRLSA